MADAPQLQLDVRTKALATIVRVNDVPLLEDRKGEGQATREGLGLWLKPGRNRLEIQVRAPLQPASGEPLVETALIFDLPEVPPLQHFAWQQPAGRPVHPFLVSIPFEAPGEPVTALWREAETIDPKDTAALEAAKEAGVRVWKAFHERDPAKVVAQLEYTLREIAAVIGKAPEELLQSATGDYASLFADASLTLVPLEMKAIRTEVMGDGQLVRLTRDGEALVRLTDGDPEGLDIRVPVLVARIKGEWRAVR